MRGPLESGQFTSIRYGERLAEIGAAPSIGTVGDSYDNALAETVIGYYKAELIRGPARTGPWKTIEEVELATLGWVHWHNTQRLHGYLGDLPPAEFEQLHAARQPLDPGVLSVARLARKAAERLPQPHLDAVEGEIASESLLEAPPTIATAQTANAPSPEDVTPGQSNGSLTTTSTPTTSQPGSKDDYATRQDDQVLA